jgi:hypothetical protein
LRNAARLRPESHVLSGQEIDLSRVYVDVQPVSPGSLGAKDSRYPGFCAAKRGSVDIANIHGRIHGAVVLGMSDANVQLPTIGFDVFIAVNAIDGELAAVEPDVEINILWNLNLGGILFGTSDLDGGLSSIGVYAKPHLVPVIGVPSLAHYDDFIGRAGFNLILA